LRGNQTDSMRGSLRAGPHGVEAVYTLNCELYRSQWFASEALARADLATHQDAHAAAGWTTVAHQP
jgi:hypothetical protein